MRLGDSMILVTHNWVKPSFMSLGVGVLKRAYPCFSMEKASPLCINTCMYCCNLNPCL